MRRLLLGQIAAIAILALATQSDARTKRDGKAIAAFKRAQHCPATGKARGACPGWVIDHVQPLACGGPDRPDNMQWQTKADAKAKDKWERKTCVTQRHMSIRNNALEP